jgi:hypothetical protein
MPRKILALGFLALSCLVAGPALASGDFGCGPNWGLKESQLDDCNNRAFLSPGNDSRVNLQLLLMDAGQAKIISPPPGDGAAGYTFEEFSALFVPPAPANADSTSEEGEGSRCNTNSAGADAFQAALKAAHGLPPAERDGLAAARAALNPNCDDASKAVAPAPATPIRSGPGKQFAAYLAGTTAFYAGDYNAARQSFASLKSSNQPWLKETALYMLGRVEVNRAQTGAFDEYGVLQLDKVDAAAIGPAEAAFRAYLHDYPDGDYAASARGLLRRVAWLGGQPQKLAAEFTAQFAHPEPGNVSEPELVQEADSKLLGSADAAKIREPLLLASYDLMQIRKDDGPPAIAVADLEAQRAAFTGHEALFDYLLAAHAFYDEGDPAGTLKRLPSAPPSGPMSNLEFSRQVLRGMALEAAKDPAGARMLWLQLLPLARPPLQRPPLELALAMNYEHDGRLAAVFAPASPIRDTAMRDILLRYSAGPDLLRQRARAADASGHERRMALFVLLYKELTRGRYSAFLADLALPQPPPAPKAEDDNAPPEPDLGWFNWAGDPTPDDQYACPTLRAVAKALAADPHQAHGRLCLSEFSRLVVQEDFDLDSTRPANQLGAGPSQFPGAGYSRLEVYKQLITDTKTPKAERAYALYRAVNCYAPSGYNHCGGTDAPQAERKQWFHVLKTQYTATPWAELAKYYW